ncbi:hypothetical protein J7J63_02500, partial [Candidatus Bipolaricaulota bacterium]|nr:hypothetical protein [Candidatus Bipolaricaulota bacterium]
KLFFENYTSLLKKIMPLLNKYHVKSLVVLDETGNLNTSYPEFIKGMLTKLSTEFNGSLGIDVGANNILEGIYWDSKKRTWQGTIAQMTFLGWISWDGKPLEDLYSCHTPLIETQKDQRVSVMALNFVKFWKPLFDYVAAKYSNPPQGFGEIGANNGDGQTLSPSYYDIPHNQRVLDEQERADYFLAALKGSKALEIMTINVWGDFYNGDFAPRLGCASISTGHYGYPASPMYRTIKAIIQPAD